MIEERLAEARRQKALERQRMIEHEAYKAIEMKDINEEHDRVMAEFEAKMEIAREKRAIALLNREEADGRQVSLRAMEGKAT